MLDTKSHFKHMLDNYPELLSVAQVCTLLGISRKHAYKLIDNGDLVSIRIAGAHRITKASLIDYLVRNTE